MKKVIRFSVEHPKFVITLLIIASVFAFIQYSKMKVDTDPENMLPKTDPVRVFHNNNKKEFSLYDFIVLGIVNERNPQGVFNVDTLTKVYEITKKIENIKGVITYELMSPSTKDDIEQAGIGTVRFKWLMEQPPGTEEEALHIRKSAMDNPMFYGTLVSEDGKALCIYVPIEKKSMSYRISQKIKKIVNKYKGDEKYYMAGLPIAEDTFGHEMFVQMAISAPLAGLIIFLLMLMFFKKVSLIIAPMIVAIITVVITMGLLIGFGFPVHIMSSMIPIFLIPIAVLDAVHILSEFFDHYQEIGDRKKTITKVIHTLFIPMLYTSLTTWIGFLSLSFSRIPPVQVFGVFVSTGVMIAWFISMTFIPAYIVLIRAKTLENFGALNAETGSSFLDKLLKPIGLIATRKWKLVLFFTIITFGISIWGISRIQVNDNPVKWFTKKHPIRIADKVLNAHFGGTYMAYLVMESNEVPEVFKRPKMLHYVERLQNYLKQKGDVGKSTSLVDVTKKVYMELVGGERAYYKIPKTKEGVAQCLISFQNSHKPDDLWHFVTPDYSKLNIWIQLRSGDNKDMEKVVHQVSNFIEKNPPPYKIKYNWAGLTYVNVAWQNKMVVGMLRNFLGSFIIVFFMMTFLFGAPIRGLISMIPLTITIVFIYGLLGIIGRNYDMPVAVLSALTLGLSIDFAIHFIQRSRSRYKKTEDWQDTAEYTFSGPGRAIARNAIVIAVGFLPLLAAPLVPYQTVGFFMAAIMFTSSIATFFILPALITVSPSLIYREREKHFLCYRGDCIFLAIAIVLSIVYILVGYTNMGWRQISYITIPVFLVLTCICKCVLKSKKVCKLLKLDKPNKKEG
jgi:hypothetical protein